MKNNASELVETYRAIGELKNNPHNSRTHKKRQIRQIADSIRAFGFTNPVLLDANNTVIAGHGRVAAAKLLGMSEVPTIRLENLSPDQIRAYMIADNRLAEKAGLDKAILAIELQHLLSIETEFDITVTGFEIPEIDLLLCAGEDEPDAADGFEVEESSEAVTRAGDLWELGKHRVLCGNALDQQSYSQLLGSKRAGVVFTDPGRGLIVAGIPAKYDNFRVHLVTSLTMKTSWRRRQSGANPSLAGHSLLTGKRTGNFAKKGRSDSVRRETSA